MQYHVTLAIGSHFADREIRSLGVDIGIDRSKLVSV